MESVKKYGSDEEIGNGETKKKKNDDTKSNNVDNI